MDEASAQEVQWLIENPDFKMRPANIREFCGPGYLNEREVRPGIMEALVETFGEEVNPYTISPVREACITGAIGIGKSTFAAISLSYMVHWVKCLYNPKEFYNLSEDSVIGFMMMSTNATLAREVIFQKVQKRIQNSEWFQKWTKLENPKLEKQMRFEGDIWIVPGTSEETSFEGYDILGGIIDEGDSHKITERRNYAEGAFNTIESRIESRFTDFRTEEHRGLMIVIGQAKSKTGFMMSKYNEFKDNPKAVAVRMSIWESFGWYRYTMDKDDIERGIETAPRNSFYYDMRRRKMLSKEAGELIMNADLIEVPMAHRKAFEKDPVKALRDLGGIPPEADDPFISQADRILECQEKWHERYKVDEPPINTACELDKIQLPSWFRPAGLDGDFRRVIHIDTAYSSEGDALGFAMGHIPAKIPKYEEERPVISFDLLMRLHTTSAVEINFGDLREFIYRLRDVHGFDIALVTIDGFNSFDFIQQLKKNHIKADYFSVDKNKAPYEELRETINDRRCLHPRYMVHYHQSDTKTVNIAYKELSELQDAGKKIDHRPDGSKDVADAMAGVVSNLVNNTSYLRAARTEAGDDYVEKPMASASEMLSMTVDGQLVKEVDEYSPISFEEFQKQQEKYMNDSRLDYKIGGGLMGSPRSEDRMW